MSFRYQSNYCEENVWWLCQQPELGPGERDVWIITNESKTCLLREQRAQKPGDEFIVWDYHVVVAAGGMVWDLDTRLDLPSDVSTYLDATFPTLSTELAHMAPQFRVVSAAEFVATFRTDRSHMKNDEGDWIAPPPPWEPVGAANIANQRRFVDLGDDVAGEILDLSALRARYSR